MNVKRATASATIAAALMAGSAVLPTVQAEAVQPSQLVTAKRDPLKWYKYAEFKTWVRLYGVDREAGTVKIEQRGSSNLIRVRYKVNSRIWVMPSIKNRRAGEVWRPVQQQNIKDRPAVNWSGNYLIKSTDRRNKTTIQFGKIDTERHINPELLQNARTGKNVNYLTLANKNYVEITHTWALQGNPRAPASKKALAKGSITVGPLKKGGGGGSW